MGATSDPEESEHRSGWGCGAALRAVASCHLSMLFQNVDLFPCMDRVSEISGQCAIFEVNGTYIYLPLYYPVLYNQSVPPATKTQGDGMMLRLPTVQILRRAFNLK